MLKPNTQQNNKTSNLKPNKWKKSMRKQNTYENGYANNDVPDSKYIAQNFTVGSKPTIEKAN